MLSAGVIGTQGKQDLPLTQLDIVEIAEGQQQQQQQQQQAYNNSKEGGDEWPRSIVIEDPDGGQRVIKPTSVKYSPRPSARGVPPTLGPPDPKSPQQLQLNIDAANSPRYELDAIKSPVRSPNNADRQNVTVMATSAAPVRTPPVPKLKLPGSTEKGVAQTLPRAPQEARGARRQSNGDDGNNNPNTNKYRRLSIKIDNPASPAQETATIKPPPTSAPPSTDHHDTPLQQKPSSVATPTTPPLSARSQHDSGRRSILTPRKTAVQPAPPELGNASTAVIFSPKRAYTTPKNEATTGLPDLRGLDEKTAKMLLEERQRINDEFTRLRKENQELVAKLAQNNQTLEMTSARDFGGLEILHQELQLLKESYRTQQERESKLKKQVEDLKANAGQSSTEVVDSLKTELEAIKRRHHDEVEILLKAQEIVAKDRQERRSQEPTVSLQPQVAQQQPAAAVAPRSTAYPDIDKSTAGLLAIPKLLWEGGHLWKFPYNNTGMPKRKWVQIKAAETRPGRRRNSEGTQMAFEPLTVVWMDPDKKRGGREVVLEDVEVVGFGHETTAFWRQVVSRGRNSLPSPDMCFSLICADRTIDFAAESAEEAKEWREALQYVLDQVHLEAAGEELPGPLADPVADEDMPPRRKRDVKDGEIKQLLGFIRLNRAEEVRTTVEIHGVPIDTPDPSTGDTALILACRLGLVEMLELCLELGAKNDPHPTYGQTALQAAVSAGHSACVRKILEAAAATGHDRVIANHEDPNGEAPVHVAARCGNAEVLMLLLSHGADVEGVDVQGRTCLHAAAAAGHKKCLAQVLDADADHLIEFVDIGGNTPLHVAAKAGKIDCVRLLLETAANPCPRNKSNDTPYQLATAKGHQQVARLLHEYDEDSEEVPPPVSSSTLRDSQSQPSTARRDSASANLPRPYDSPSDQVQEARARPLEVPSLDLSGLAQTGATQASARSKSVRLESSAAVGSSLFKGLDVYAVQPPDMPRDQAWAGSTQPVHYTASQQAAASHADTANGELLTERMPQTARIHTGNPELVALAWSGRPSGQRSVPLVPLPQQQAPVRAGWGQSDTGDNLAFDDSHNSHFRRERRSSRRRAASGSSSGSSDYDVYNSSPVPYRRQRSGGHKSRRKHRHRSSRSGSGSYEEHGYSPREGEQVVYDRPYNQTTHNNWDASQTHMPAYANEYYTTGGYEHVPADQQTQYYSEQDMSGHYHHTATNQRAESLKPYATYSSPAYAPDYNYGDAEQAASSTATGNEYDYSAYYEFAAETDYYVGEEHWRVQYTEDNWPYHMHVNSGHTQWEDPSTAGVIYEASTEAEDASAEPMEGIPESSADRRTPTPKSLPSRSPVGSRPPPPRTPPSGRGTPSAPSSPPPQRRSPLSSPPPRRSPRLPSPAQAKVMDIAERSMTPEVAALPEFVGRPGGLIEQLKRSAELKETAAQREAAEQAENEGGTETVHDGEGGEEKQGPSSAQTSPRSPTGGYNDYKDAMQAAKRLLEASSPPPLSPIPPSAHDVAGRLMTGGLKLKPVSPSPSHTEPGTAGHAETTTASVTCPVVHSAPSAPVTHEPSLSLRSPAASTPRAEAKSATPAPSEPLSAKGIEALKDGPELGPYLRMKKTGVPLPAIKQKMIMDKVDPRLVEAFESVAASVSVASTAVSTPTPEPPRPDAKPATPSAAPKDPVESTPTQSKDVASPAPSLEELKQDPKLAKYCRMVSVGVPRPSVYGKMAADGISPRSVDRFKAGYGDIIIAAALPAPSPRPGLVVDKEALKQEPKFTRYFRMVSVGVPAASVYGKMAAEGMSPEDIKLFKMAMGEAVEPGTPTGAKSPATPRREVPLLKMHWEALSSDKVSEKSVWSTTPREGKLEEAELKELEVLFAAKPTQKTESATSTPRSARREVQLLDVKRGNNVAIGLAQFKSFNGHENLFRAVVELDSTQLNVERLANLEALLPTPAELQLVKQYRGPVSDLGTAEQFFHSILRFPRMEPRVKAFMFKLQFQSIQGGIRQTCAKITRACKQVRTSEGFAAVLQRLLIVGNAMNEGTNRGGAAGFSLESLLKVTQMKGVDKKTTVLDYIVRQAFEKKDDALLEFPNDFTDVGEAEKMPAREVEKDVAKLKAQLDEMSMTLRLEKETLQAAQKTAASETSGPIAALGDISIESLSKFTIGVEAFYYDAVEEYQRLSTESKQMSADIRTLAEYFAENPETCEAQTVFSTVLTFVKIFNQSKEMCKRLKKAQERQDKQQQQKRSSEVVSPAPEMGGGGGSTPTTPSRRAEERKPLRRGVDERRHLVPPPTTPPRSPANAALVRDSASGEAKPGPGL